MKAVMAPVDPAILEWRRRSGADRFDEMWEGVLHMSPSPGTRHQRLEGDLEFWLRLHWARSGAGILIHPVNICRPAAEDWTKDFRLPDLALLTPARLAEIDRDTHWEGGPEVVVEIRTPGDETYDKLPFYAEAGCLEAWVVHRDTRAPEVFVLGGEALAARAEDPDGWVRSPYTGVWLRAEAGKLCLQREGDASTRELLPTSGA